MYILINTQYFVTRGDAPHSGALVNSFFAGVQILKLNI